MRLADFLDEQRVSVSIEARTKGEALEALASLLACGTTLDSRDVLHGLEDRESLGSTGIGSGVAIPHARIGGLDRTIAALSISARGVEFDAIDGKPVHLFVALVAPAKHAADHLKALARISRLLKDDAVRDRLRRAPTPRDAFDIAIQEDGFR